MEQEKSGKVFSFQDNCIWTGINKFSQFRTGFLSLAVNILPSHPQV